ncbi:hypothetical protein UAK_03142 [Enterococcus raffinosus ATCC 49464]|uniref:Uncharacterized protein n=1 Tax=Enterococcus raffinosus ATCC 49464 TaxID=1158602 RepID=R2NWU4_9ENTE|nr:hypothetical protein UAK_03142 [Enterococcus raffinosus ATCC 49464]EOT70897.1 hypothetical protein I590_04237 [Enterococcus raffinosus ATCC 49464]EZP95831.1 hypothetical protein Z971_15525 [Enterococcus faecium VRE0576]
MRVMTKNEKIDMLYSIILGLIGLFALFCVKFIAFTGNGLRFSCLWR